MKVIYAIISLILLNKLAFAYDPFLNPIKLKEIQLETSKKENFQVNKASIFSPVILKPINELSVQGVISSNNSYRLVLQDPSTGEVFILKEGEPISKNEKIVKITPKKVVIAVYKRKGKSIIRSLRILKVDLGGE